MNAAELAALLDRPEPLRSEAIREAAAETACAHGRPVFVTLSERGLLAAGPDGETHHVAAVPVPEPIDIVGAGDAVSANLAAALAGGATLPEALTLAAIAASVVIRQLGTTGTADVADLAAGLSG
jgi:sugar/nucleoside kinase (ribokinase family)